MQIVQKNPFGYDRVNQTNTRHIMKNIRFLTFVLLLGTLVLSACGAGAMASTPTVAATARVDAMPVSFIGIVDSIAGDQWVISGTTMTVDASIVRDGPFNVGDQVKVEGFVRPDGSFTVSRIETPTPQETATLPPFADDNSNDGVTNANTNDANINDGNVNDDNDNDGNSNDDNSNSSNSNDSNTNDDDGGSSNDDNSNSGNDYGDDGGVNSNDDNSNDDHGGDNSNGNDDNGGNSNDD
jgi:hypothetical protein